MSEPLMAHEHTPDVFLTAFARLAEAGFELSITIAVNGVILEGDVISEKSHLDFYTDQMKRAQGQPTEGSAYQDDVEPRWRKMFQVIESILSGLSIPPSKTIEYLHLRDVRVIGTSLAQGNWRIRISDVSAWMLGRSGNTL